MYSTRRHMLGPERPEAVSPQRPPLLSRRMGAAPTSFPSLYFDLCRMV